MQIRCRKRIYLFKVQSSDLWQFWGSAHNMMATPSFLLPVKHGHRQALILHICLGRAILVHTRSNPRLPNKAYLVPISLTLAIC